MIIYKANSVHSHLSQSASKLNYLLIVPSCEILFGNLFTVPNTKSRNFLLNASIRNLNLFFMLKNVFYLNFYGFLTGQYKFEILGMANFFGHPPEVVLLSLNTFFHRCLRVGLFVVICIIDFDVLHLRIQL